MKKPNSEIKLNNIAATYPGSDILVFSAKMMYLPETKEDLDRDMFRLTTRIKTSLDSLTEEQKAVTVEELMNPNTILDPDKFKSVVGGILSELASNAEIMSDFKLLGFGEDVTKDIAMLPAINDIVMNTLRRTVDSIWTDAKRDFSLGLRSGEESNAIAILKNGLILALTEVLIGHGRYCMIHDFVDFGADLHATDEEGRNALIKYNNDCSKYVELSMDHTDDYTEWRNNVIDTAFEDLMNNPTRPAWAAVLGVHEFTTKMRKILPAHIDKVTNFGSKTNIGVMDILNDEGVAAFKKLPKHMIIKGQEIITEFEALNAMGKILDEKGTPRYYPAVVSIIDAIVSVIIYSGEFVSYVKTGVVLESVDENSIQNEDEPREYSIVLEDFMDRMEDVDVPESRMTAMLLKYVLAELANTMPDLDPNTVVDIALNLIQLPSMISKPYMLENFSMRVVAPASLTDLRNNLSGIMLKPVQEPVEPVSDESATK